MKPRTKVLAAIYFVMILGVAAFSRFYGNNWDQGQHLNPDERFLTMVATGMEWPASVKEYLDTDRSKLNPHNNKNDFYVYGTWPVILVKFIAEKMHQGDYGGLTLIGRIISGLCDMLTLMVVFLFGKRLSFLLRANAQHDKRQTEPRDLVMGLFSMGLYGLMALPIQLSHFYTTDPYLTLFLTISLFILLFSPSLGTGVLLGVSTGFALSAKISGFLIFPVICLYGLVYIFPELSSAIKRSYRNSFNTEKSVWKSLFSKCVQLFIFYSVFSVFFYLSFRLLMPYLFATPNLITVSLNHKVLDNWKTLEGFNNANAWFPPSVQWINQAKISYPFFDIAFIGLGLPMAMVCFSGILLAIKKTKKYSILLLPLAVVGVTFFYQGVQFGMNMRYFLPLYPVFAVMGGLFLLTVYSSSLWKKQPVRISSGILIGISLLIWPVSFLRIYTRPHSRVSASEWIYTNIPPGSHVSYEHWDDPLPLNLPDYPASNNYPGVELPMFGDDSPEKWKDLEKKLDTVDYLVLSSNRVYGSTGSVPERYPLTAKFYDQLFSGKLAFKKVAEFTSRPGLSIPIDACIPIPLFNYGFLDTRTKVKQPCQGIEFIDDYTDESWTVYDHPKVTIFQKKF